LRNNALEKRKTNPTEFVGTPCAPPLLVLYPSRQYNAAEDSEIIEQRTRENVPKNTHHRHHDFEIGLSPSRTPYSCTHSAGHLLRYRIAPGSHRPDNFVSGRCTGNMYELPRHDRCLRFPQKFFSWTECFLQRLPSAPYIHCQRVCVQSGGRSETRFRFHGSAGIANDAPLFVFRPCRAGKLFAVSRRADVRSVGSRLPNERSAVLGLPSGHCSRPSSIAFCFTKRVASCFAICFGIASDTAIVRQRKGKI